MSRGVEGLVFVGFMFIGMGIGMLLDRVAVGTLIGMGIGFIAMAILRIKASKSE
ncbi:MAG: hypothetical protein F7C81_05140 [Desulfurococcales archaeon]|nr:hypothetical protein [Desulfurococcales archaeon]